MIDTTLTFLESVLNEHLGARFPGAQPHAVVANVAAEDGAAAAHIENRLVLSLVNIERESAVSGPALPVRAGAGYVQQQPPLYLNLYVLLTASFKSNYKQSLRFLGTALGFFQATPVFNAHSGPNFPREAERLTIELVGQSIQDLNNLWAIMGAKYQPSALYKVRMVVLQENWMRAALPAIGDVDVSVGARS